MSESNARGRTAPISVAIPEEMWECFIRGDIGRTGFPSELAFVRQNARHLPDSPTVEALEWLLLATRTMKHNLVIA